MSAREHSRAWGFLATLGLWLSCTVGRAPQWPEVLRVVRARYPSVAQLSVAELEQRAASTTPPLLLDARAPAEFAQSQLAGARSTPDEDAAVATLNGVAPGTEIVVYCSVGMRSSALAERLAARGFTRVENLEGGIFAWANAGKPTFRGAAREDRVHPYDKSWGSLLVPERRAQ